MITVKAMAINWVFLLFVLITGITRALKLQVMLCGVDDKQASKPLVNIQQAIEHGPVEIVDFPLLKVVDLSSS